MVRNRMRFAGTWYSADPANLSQSLDTLLRDAADRYRSDGGRNRDNRPLEAAILPHAGIDFSGQGMARGFLPLQEDVAAGNGPRRIVILAPSHYIQQPPDSILTGYFESHETPLGDIPGDRGTAMAAARKDSCVRDDDAIEREHAVEMFFPFVYSTSPSVPLSAYLVGPFSGTESLRRMAESLYDPLWAGDGAGRTFFIISSDFTHYGRRFGYEPFGSGMIPGVPDRVRSMDLRFAGLAAAGDVDGFFTAAQKERPTICGRNAILLYLALRQIAAERGEIGEESGRTVSYYTSADITGSSRDFVCYATVVFP